METIAVNIASPVIVIATYDRPDALKRLLNSVAAARYPDNAVRLVISVDHSENFRAVTAIADAFNWPFGDKEVLLAEENLGLRAHILQCGDLSQSFEHIILLEDDLYVSPNFYFYAIAAQRQLANDSRIAGVSLYQHVYNETAKLAFIPEDDGYDNYFMQLPSSWGQSWTATQWRGFRRWYDEHSSAAIDDDGEVPHDVVLWPESSWKKYFMKYMVADDLYFLFPRRSLTTNFMDPGTHHAVSHSHLQVTLEQTIRNYEFAGLDDSCAVYDAYCEPLPKVAFRELPGLAAYIEDLAVDLYGEKPLAKSQNRYVLTAKHSRNPIRTWGRHLKPHERNISHDLAGETFALTLATDCDPEPPRRFFEDANYYHGVSPQFNRLETTSISAESYGTLIAESEETPASGELGIALTHKLLATRTKELHATKLALEEALASTSWRITQPLRWCKRLIDRVRLR